MLAAVTIGRDSSRDSRVGQRIKQRREDLGISQAELTRLSGYAQQTHLARVENEGVVPGGLALVRIAQALDTSAEWLITGDSVASIAPASMRTLSPRADDPEALEAFAELLRDMGAPLSPDELAWLRMMPAASSTADYQVVTKARRAADSRSRGQPPVRISLAAPLAVLPATSFVQETEAGKRAPKLKAKPMKRRER